MHSLSDKKFSFLAHSGRIIPFSSMYVHVLYLKLSIDFHAGFVV